MGTNPPATGREGEAPAEPLLRALGAHEAEALLDFYNGLPEEARRLFRPLGWEASLDQCQAVCEAIGDGSRHDLVIEASGRIVGWAFLRKLDTTEADLGIGIAEPHTGRGLGRRLMDALIAHARERGVAAITLCHVADNARARRLYEPCGFVETHRARHDDGLNYVHMRLTLRPACG